MDADLVHTVGWEEVEGGWFAQREGSEWRP